MSPPMCREWVVLDADAGLNHPLLSMRRPTNFGIIKPQTDSKRMARCGMSWRGPVHVALYCAVLLGGSIGVPRAGQSATQQEINTSIDRARAALKRLWEKAPAGGQRTLMAVALLKAGEPHDGPIEKAEIDAIRAKIRDGMYTPVASVESIYVAGVEAMLIGEIQDEAVRTELMAPVAKFLLVSQRQNGSWDYVYGGERGTNGDTSVTQYACLGLWAAQRAGTEIDPSVWERAVTWHVQSADPDGRVRYLPGKADSAPTPQMAVNSLSSMHIALLQINPAVVPKLLDGTIPVVRPEVPKDQKKFGFLEAVPLDQRKLTKTAPVTSNQAVSQSAGTACQKIYRTLLPSMRDRKVLDTHLYYYLYSVERLAALADRKDFDGYDWYGENADLLVRNQRPDGTWMGGSFGEAVDSSFAVMFLGRATGKLLNREAPTIRKIGGGLLAGGRGLPDNLSAPPKPKKSSPLGDLLSSLEKANADLLEETQEELVEKVQLGDRKELIGNTELILRLLGHPTPAVRQTAVWALGRTNNLSLARHLIRALDDKDPAVRVEAHNALCWMTRNPTAFDLVADPLADVPEDAPAEARAAAQSAWQRDAFLAWGAWYLDRRPFADRGDEFETWLRTRLRELK